MNKQPEALRLADIFDFYAIPLDIDAAKELRRLHEELKKANEQAEHFERLWYLRGDLNGELLEALKSLVNSYQRLKPMGYPLSDSEKQAQAAIAKATGDEK